MRAVAGLLGGNTIQESANLAGCSENAVDRWLKLPHFQDALNQGKKSAFNVACLKLGNAFSLSVDTLVSLMQDEETSTNSKIRCADLLLQNGLKMAELDSLNERLSQIEITLYE